MRPQTAAMPRAPMLIGRALAGVPAFLAYESRILLIGETTDPALVAGIREIAAGKPDVTSAGQRLTMPMDNACSQIGVRWLIEPALQRGGRAREHDETQDIRLLRAPTDSAKPNREAVVFHQPASKSTCGWWK